MPKQDQEEQWRRADEEVRKNLPPGVKLVRTLRGHTGWIGRIAWSPDGRMLASPSDGQNDPAVGCRDGRVPAHAGRAQGRVYSVAFDPTGGTLASGSDDKTVKLWEPASGKLLRTLEGHKRLGSLASPLIRRAARWPAGVSTRRSSCGSRPAASCSARWKGTRTRSVASPLIRRAARWPAGVVDKTVKLWEPASGKLLRTLEGHGEFVLSVAFDPTGRTLASGELRRNGQSYGIRAAASGCAPWKDTLGSCRQR